jgi:hypothetical protein
MGSVERAAESVKDRLEWAKLMEAVQRAQFDAVVVI